MPTARELYDRFRAGDTLTPEESAALSAAVLDNLRREAVTPRGFWDATGRQEWAPGFAPSPPLGESYEPALNHNVYGPKERALPTEGTPVGALPEGYAESVSTFDPPELTARELYDKHRRGETLTSEESAVLESALAAGGYHGSMGRWDTGPYWTEKGRIFEDTWNYEEDGELLNPATDYGTTERALPAEGTPVSALPPGYTESVSTYDPTYAIDPTVYNQSPGITVGAVPPAVDLANSLESGSYTGPTSFPTPAENAGITSPYGNRTHPVTRREKLHTGIDIGDPGPGNLAGEPAVSIAPGVVQSAGPAGGYGNQVVVQHPDASVSTYNHLDSITVNPGQEVAAGWEVGKIGTTGTSTGPHLHLEVFDPAGNRINPNDLVNSLQTASQIAAGNTTANAVGQYGPETAVLGSSLQTPLADPPLVPEALSPLQTAFTPFTPSPNLAALPAAQAIEGIRVRSPTLPPAAIAQPTPLASPPITQRAIPVGPLPAAISPALPAARSPSLPVANSPATTPVAGGQPVEEFGPPASLAGPPSFDARMAASQQRLREALEALPGGPVTPQPISVGGVPSPVLGALSNDPLSRPFSLPAAQIAELSAARPLSPTTVAQPISPSVAARPLSPTVAAQPIQVGITASTTPLPRAAAGPVQDVLPSTAPVGPFPARPEAPPGGFPVAEAPGLVDVFGPLFTQSAPAVPPSSSPGPTAFLTSPEANPAYAPSVPAQAPSFQSAFGPEQALQAGITMGAGAVPWDQSPPAVYNPPDLIAGPPAIPGLPNVSAPQDKLYNTVAPAGNLLSPTLFDPTLPVNQPGINMGSIGATPVEATGFVAPSAAKPLPVVQVPGAPAAPATPGAPPVVQAPAPKPAPVPSTPDLVSAAVAPDIQEMTQQPITVGPKPNIGLRAPVGTQDLISGAVGGLLGGPVGAIAAPLGQRMLGSLGNLMGNPIQRMMEERERQRLEAEEHGISVGLGYGGPTSGMGRAFAGGGGGYERSFGVGPIGGFGGPTLADQRNYGK